MARLAQNIFKRKDGRFEGRYIKERDADGKALYASVYSRSYKELKEKLGLAQKAAREKTLPDAQKTVVALAELYLETMKIQLKQSTHDVYQRYLDNHIAPHFADLRCDQLSQNMVQSFVNVKHASGLSPVTVQSVFCFLRKSLCDVSYGSIFEINLPKCNAREADALSLVEQKRLEAAAKESDDIDRMAIILCLYTGIRIGELCGLMWSDIDYERRLLHIRRTSQRIKDSSGKAKTQIAFLPPKSPSSSRSIPLPEFLLNILKEQQSGCEGDFIISRAGNFVEPRSIQYRFKRLLKTVNLRPVKFHTLRHTFSVRALENGFDVKTLCEILGHSSPVVTLSKYAHTLDEHKRRSMDVLAALHQ